MKKQGDPTLAALSKTAEPAGAGAAFARGTFDPHRVRRDFPILSQKFHGKPLIYLDNGATTQKPLAVIEALRHYYQAENANVHRGVYALSQLATERYEQARHKIRRCIGARETKEIIFTRGTTDAINLVAASYGRAKFKPGDEVIISAMEHHSNIVPWQLICQQTGAKLRVIPMDDRGELSLDEYRKLLNERTKFVSVVYVSNSLGTINPVRKIIELAHERGIPVLVDAAQSVAHMPTDVQELDADFLAFSGHKVFGPTGIGVLYGKARLLEEMPPYQGGGDMISSVTFEKTEYNELPYKFEAGTPNIAGAVGLGAAIDYLAANGIDLAEVSAYETELLHYAQERIAAIDGLRIIGTAAHKAGVVSFLCNGIHPYDLANLLDAEGIAVRTGHHCCQPVMDRFGIPGTVRMSIAMYNTREDVDALADALKRISAGLSGATTNAGKPAPPAPPAQESLSWPSASAPSPAAAADEIAAEFEFFGSAEEKNAYVLELAAKLPHTFDLLKKVSVPVPGCMSEVYFIARPSKDGREIEFLADANAEIVRGLISLLLRIFSGQRGAEILAFDFEAFLRRVGLERFISAQRRNGLAGMIKRIRVLTEKLTS